MLVQKIPISKINPAPYNPRKDLKPGDDEYERLKKSIKEFDLVEPLIWNKRTGNLVGGHQRLKIMKNEMNLQEADVSVVDLDVKKEKALNVALNKISGEWDFPKLKELLVELDDGSFDLSLTGFDEIELKELIDYEGKKGLTEDDAVPEVPEKPITKTGDLYLLGEHRLLCGDSTKKEDVLFLMDGEKAVLMNTDPPYGDSWVEKAKDMQKHGYGHSRAVLHGSIESDDLSKEDFKEFVSLFLETSKSIAIEDRPFVFYVWHRAKRKIFEDALIESGYFVHQPIIWVKPGFVIGRLNYHPRCEIALHGWIQAKGRCPFYGERNQSDVWEVGRENEGIHPTQKPVELFTRPLLNHTKEGDVCYEPFSGSGSQFIAAEKLNRRCFGLEISPAYCDVIVKRWEQFTGKKAELQKERVAA